MDKKDITDLQQLIADGESAREAAHHDVAAQNFGKAADKCRLMVVDLHCAHARALLASESFEAAQKASEAALRVKENHAVAWYLTASAMFKQHSFEEAKKAFMMAVAHEDDLDTVCLYRNWAARCDAPAGSTDTPGVQAASSTEPVDNEPYDTTRMQWYQSKTHVHMDIYAKNVDKAKSTVTFGERSLSMRLSRPEKEDYLLDAYLAEAINPSTCMWSASRFKVEMVMCKAAAGITWRSLDADGNVVSAAVEAGHMSKRRLDVGKEKQKGWDSFADKELKDYKEGDGAMDLFRNIYKDSDENTRRAMMKSYSESGGQVLSTNWDEVKKKKVIYEGDD